MSCFAGVDCCISSVCWCNANTQEIEDGMRKCLSVSLDRMCMRHRWKEFGDNQPTSKDKVFCCPACGKGRLFEWQLTTFCPHCGLKLSKPKPPKEET